MHRTKTVIGKYVVQLCVKQMFAIKTEMKRSMMGLKWLVNSPPPVGPSQSDAARGKNED